MPQRLRPEILKEVAAVARRVDALGWGEGSAGNLSLVCDAGMLERPLYAGRPLEPWAVPAGAPALPEGRYLLISAGGVRMRELAEDPAAGLCLIGRGRDGLVLSRESGRPSSELPSHLAAQGGAPPGSAILHVHPDHLIALTLLPSLRGAGVLEGTLASLMPETALALERGLRRLPYAHPGGGALAAFSADAFAEADAVIWDQHGALVRAKGLSAALDRMEMLEKAARVWLLAARAGERPEGFRDGAARAGSA